MFNDADVLKYYPFDGDFGSPGDRILKNKIGVARKSGQCHICAHEIQPGERIRMMTGLFDGYMATWRWCNLCCEAMALSWSDNGEALEARFALRPWL